MDNRPLRTPQNMRDLILFISYNCLFHLLLLCIVSSVFTFSISVQKRFSYFIHLILQFQFRFCMREGLRLGISLYEIEEWLDEADYDQIHPRLNL